ncbi:MAG TPA: hypothetical protein VFV31_12095, partial [Chitinophagaceae bacterium]|nr:hypothetical protein [Chitinophagaceae bacterium]
MTTILPNKPTSPVNRKYIPCILSLIFSICLYGQCPTDVSLNINRQGSSVTVKPGTSLRLEFSYKISNSSSCPGCIDQILVGLDNKYLDCVYSGMPSVCPNRRTGTFTKTINAPTAPGTYKFYFNTTQDYSCKANLYKPSTYIGSITVPAPCGLKAEAQLNLNGQGNQITVKPGSPVNLAFTYTVANQENCPGCITQVLWGLNNQYMGCIYNGTPSVCPGSTNGNFSQQITAPAAPGTYQVYIHPDQNYDCNPAAYKGSVYTGTLTVQADCQQTATVSLNMNGAGNTIAVKPGTIIQMEMDYNLSNQSSCPTCFSQLLFGYENQFLGCLFDGTPGVCPTGSSGRQRYQFTAPAIPGVYKIGYNSTQDYSCKPTLYRPEKIMGTVEVLPDCSANATVTLNMNSLGNAITVKPAATVNMQFSYNISTSGGQQRRPLKILFGYENNFGGVVYQGTPAICPASSTGTSSQ